MVLCEGVTPSLPAGVLYPHTPTLLRDVKKNAVARDVKQQPAVRSAPCGGIIPPRPRTIAGREENTVARDVKQQPAVRSAPTPPHYCFMVSSPILVK